MKNNSIKKHTILLFLLISLKSQFLSRKRPFKFKRSEPITGPYTCCCPCAQNTKPVCSVRNITYKNECIMNCENHDWESYKGPCITPGCGGFCPFSSSDNSWVCGSDGKYYRNSCFINCAGTTEIPCPLDQLSTSISSAM